MLQFEECNFVHLFLNLNFDLTQSCFFTDKIISLIRALKQMVSYHQRINMHTEAFLPLSWDMEIGFLIV